MDASRSVLCIVYSSILCLIGPLSTHKDVLVTDSMAVLVMKRALSKRSLVAMALLKESGYVMSCSKLTKEVNMLWIVLLKHFHCC